MKRAIILLTSFGLLVVPVLVVDTLLPLKVDAHLDTPYHEVVANRNLSTLITGDGSIDVTFDALAPAAIRTATQTVVPTPTDATEPQPTSSVTLAPESAVATSIATHTARVGSEPSSSLLDRLVRNKPSIWGNKGFYILLGVLYLTLLCLFLKQIISPFKRQP